jgi:hypothetical protein
MMKVEAVKQDNGLLIPMLDVFKKIHQNTIWLNVELLEPEQPQADEYTALDSLIGLCETHQTDASRNHDAILYGRRKNG